MNMVLGHDSLHGDVHDATSSIIRVLVALNFTYINLLNEDKAQNTRTPGAIHAMSSHVGIVNEHVPTRIHHVSNNVPSNNSWFNHCSLQKRGQEVERK